MNQHLIYGATNRQLLQQLGRAMKQRRINAGLTQQDLAEKAGLKPLTVFSLEHGKNVSLETFIAVLRELGLLNIFYADFLQEEVLRPSIQISRKKRIIQRVRKSKNEE